jgi:hypothetical protein
MGVPDAFLYDLRSDRKKFAYIVALLRDRLCQLKCLLRAIILCLLIKRTVCSARVLKYRSVSYIKWHNLSKRKWTVLCGGGKLMKQTGNEEGGLNYVKLNLFPSHARDRPTRTIRSRCIFPGRTELFASLFQKTQWTHFSVF